MAVPFASVVVGTGPLFAPVIVQAVLSDNWYVIATLATGPQDAATVAVMACTWHCVIVTVFVLKVMVAFFA